MSELVYDADGNTYWPAEAEAKGIVPVEMVETIYEYTLTHRVAVWAPKDLAKALGADEAKRAVEFFVRDNAESAYRSRGHVTIRKVKGEARDTARTLNLRGQSPR